MTSKLEISFFMVNTPFSIPHLLLLNSMHYYIRFPLFVKKMCQTVKLLHPDLSDSIG